VKAVNSNRTENLITKNIPATTRVEEWIRAEAGVGASIASGSQTCEKNWAAFIPPDKTKHVLNRLIKCIEYSPMKK